MTIPVRVASVIGGCAHNATGGVYTLRRKLLRTKHPTVKTWTLLPSAMLFVQTL